MNKIPPRWTAKQFAVDAEKSAAAFRVGRLAPTEAWKQHFTKSREHFTALFAQLGALAPDKISDASPALGPHIWDGASREILTRTRGGAS